MKISALYWYIPDTSNPSERILIGGLPVDLGWAFQLYLYNNIPSFDAWKVLWEAPNSRIIYSYTDMVLSPEEMMVIITFREYTDLNDEEDEEQYLRDNNAVIGLHKLAHTRVGDNGCIENCSTWDLIKID